MTVTSIGHVGDVLATGMGKSPPGSDIEHLKGQGDVSGGAAPTG
jgi:hypothetical protein